MKINDLFEDIGGDLENDLNDLISIAKGNGLHEIETNQLVQQLNSMGYAISPESLVSLLQQGSQVSDANLELITIGAPPLDADQNPEQNKDKVEQMAIQSGMKGIQK